MFFEGSEKKAEIILTADTDLFGAYDDAFWAKMVDAACAQILSKISNDNVTAYLLSESSLFIWRDRLLIITCGTTKLVDAVEFFLNAVDSSNIEQVIYQRKNEYFAHSQPSNIIDDTRRLSAIHPGTTYRFGELDSHHGYLFSLDVDFEARDNDRTFELLIYGIQDKAIEALTDPSATAGEIYAFLGLDKLLSGFQVNDHVFEPFGYSLNAISDTGDYLTIHVTPQANSSYVSVEASIDLIEHLAVFLSALRPASFDLMTYNDDDFAEKIEEMVPSDYVAKERVGLKLPSGYDVRFASFIKPQTKFTKPTKVGHYTSTEGEQYVL